MTQTAGYLIALVLLIVLFILHRYTWNYWQRTRVVHPECKAHEWRSIAEPYARQCRKCARVEFREGPNGEFPEGFREYFEYIDYLRKERLL